MHARQAGRARPGGGALKSRRRIGPDAFKALRRAVKGQVLLPPAEAYRPALAGFQGMYAPRPRVLVECIHVEDVRAAVRFARDHGLPLSVRGGGHSIASHGLVDGGVAVDLYGLRGVQLSADGKTARVGGGCVWADVLDALSPRGLGTPGGFAPRVGVGGLTLGGGYGLLTRRFGLSCDNLVAADVVDAEGRLLRTDEEAQPELLWALRGAGANFGAVTSFTFRVHRLEPVYGGTVAVPLAQGRDFLRRWRDLARALPDQATAYAGVRTVPGGPDVVFALTFHLGDPAAGERFFAPLRRAAGVMHDDLGLKAYHLMHGQDAETLGSGLHHRWRTGLLEDLGDDALDAVVAQGEAATGHAFYTVLEHLGGAMGALRPDQTSFPHRRARFGVAATASWAEGAPGAGAQVDAVQKAARKAALGVYVNYVQREHGPAEVKQAYGENLPRLRALKARFDPDNVFRSNVNILPDRR